MQEAKIEALIRELHNETRKRRILADEYAKLKREEAEIGSGWKENLTEIKTFRLKHLF